MGTGGGLKLHADANGERQLHQEGSCEGHQASIEDHLTVPESSFSHYTRRG